MTKRQPLFTLYYFHDPMCSWCWGFRPVWLSLQQNLPGTVRVKYVLGGLAADSSQPMPEKLRVMIKSTWLHIQEELGTEFNFDFWAKNTPQRSTYPACRAVIAAHQQGKEVEMITAIQKAYYLRALNPSDACILQQLAKEVALNEFDFNRELLSEKTEQTLKKQIAQAKRWRVPGYPSMVLERTPLHPAKCENTLANKPLVNLSHIPVNYHHYQKMLAHIDLAISKF